jgi:anti-sigma B factor antagonist
MGAEPSLRVLTDTTDGITRLGLRGELDMASVGHFDHALADCERDGSKVIVVDLQHLTFMDSSGLRAVLRARARSAENGHDLLVVAGSSRVRTIFEVTGMDSVLDEREAVTTLDQFATNGHHRTLAGEEPGDRSG